MRIFVLALFAGLLLVPLAPAAEPGASPPPLPSARCCMAAFEFNGSAYLIGGRTDDWQIRDEILRYDPATRNFTLEARLPAPRHAAAVAHTGNGAFLFGGHDATWDVDTILRFDPSGKQVTSMTARLPKALRGMHAAWDGRGLPDVGCPTGCAYLFGGIHEGLGIREENLDVYRYDPSMDRLTVMRSKFPSFAEAGPVVFFDGVFHVLGASRNVTTYDPVADRFAATGLRFDHPTSGGALAWDGRVATLVGGIDGTQASPAAQLYEPASGSMSSVIVRPSLHGAAAASLQGHVHVFGGLDDAWQDTDRVFVVPRIFFTDDSRDPPTLRPQEPARPMPPEPYPPGQAPPPPYRAPPEPMRPTPIMFEPSVPAHPPMEVHVSHRTPWFAWGFMTGFFGTPFGGLVWLFMLR